MKLFDYKNVLNDIQDLQIRNIEKEVLIAKEKLLNKTGKGNNFVGWVTYASEIDDSLINRIQEVAKTIKSNSKVLVVIGIGGSYLGGQAAISMLTPYYKDPNELEVIFVGNTLSSTYTQSVLNYVKDKDFSVNVISKSGTTTEPAIIFRLFKNLLERNYGPDYFKRIFCTTTIGKGVLYDVAVANHYEIFSIPEDIGGRYSVLTPVGLLPMAVSDIDINEVIRGACDAYQVFKNQKYMENDALLYAAIRNLLYRKGKKIEILVSYEPNLRFFGEWYKQLFGESEGKNHRGIYPSSVTYTADLHSLGQYVQDGERHLFETVVNVIHPTLNLKLQKETVDFDELNYLDGKTLDEVNKQALQGTILAHLDGEVPNLVINVEKLNAYNFGYLVYFFMFACGISGYLLDVNPFDQEGVEAYKKNMFALLGKPGYEKLREELVKKL